METTHLYRHKRRDALDEMFFKRVYEIVAQIPEGKVVTYGQIAAMIGEPKAAQKIGGLWPAPLRIYKFPVTEWLINPAKAFMAA
jgi:hypothetical protein